MVAGVVGTAQAMTSGQQATVQLEEVLTALRDDHHLL
jgi:hypothetical protein